MRLLLAVLLSFATAWSGSAAAQQPAASGPRTCSFRSLDGSGVSGGAGDIVDLQDPFEVTCTDGTRVRARSGVVDRASRVVTLTSDVYFEDPTQTLTSDRAVYEINAGRLHATGNVVFTNRTEGTTLRNSELEYFRVMEGRPEALVNAPGRPHLTLQRRDSAGGSTGTGEPLQVDADYMNIVGQDNLTAIGNVVIQDAQMRAVGDEAEHRGVAETLELRGNAEIHSREYSLTGETIFARIPGGALSEVEARGDAELLGAELTVEAPRLDLLFENELLQRSIARSDSLLSPGVRPIASSATFRLEADSIEAMLPDQKLRTVVAIGNARGESIDTTTADSAGAAPIPADSAAAAAGPEPVAGSVEAALAQMEQGEALPPASALELVASDWIVGDTITGYFTEVEEASDSAAVSDTLAAGDEPPPVLETTEAELAPDSTVVLERLVALGAARSLYHVAPQADSPPGTKAGINFLSAAMIELIFRDGQVDVANVEGLRRGLYLEPLDLEAAEEEEAADGAEGDAEEEVPTTEEAAEPPPDEQTGEAQ